MIYKFTIVFLPALGIRYCAVPDLLPPSDHYDLTDGGFSLHQSYKHGHIFVSVVLKLQSHHPVSSPTTPMPAEQIFVSGLVTVCQRRTTVQRRLLTQVNVGRRHVTPHGGNCPRNYKNVL